MLRCSLCLLFDISPIDHDESRLESLLDHAEIHKSQINRFAKTNIFKIFTDCFPKIAANYTIREIVDLMEALRNDGSNDGTKGKTTSVPAKTIKKVPQRESKILVKNIGKQARIHKRKHSSGQSANLSIHVQCLKILASCNKSQRRFHCGLCNDLVVLRSGDNGGLYPSCAINHVLLHHMDIKPFRCRNCDYTAKNRFAMCSHVKRIHQAPDNRSIHFIDETDAHKKEICEMVATCFGNKQWKASKSDSSTKIKLTKQCKGTTSVADSGNQSATCDEKKNRSHGPPMIVAHCRQTAASYSKEQLRFECGICGKFITFRTGPNALLNPALVAQHALGHMDIKPYRCRYCIVATKTQSDIGRHVKKAHKVARSSSVHYINEVSAHEKEVCEMITTCFSKKDQQTSEPASQ